MDIQEKRNEYMRNYNKNPLNREKKRIRDNKYSLLHRKEAIIKSSEWNKKHKEYRKKYLKKYYQETKELQRESKRIYGKKYNLLKWNTDINYKLTKILRSRIRSCLKNNKKGGSAVKNLGCTLDELKNHIEKQFKEGMNWQNWNHKTWHLDHIKPLSLFNLSDRKQFLEACHYTNLQPMWAKDNLIKHNHYDHPTIKKLV